MKKCFHNFFFGLRGLMDWVIQQYKRFHRGLILSSTFRNFTKTASCKQSGWLYFDWFIIALKHWSKKNVASVLHYLADSVHLIRNWPRQRLKGRRKWLMSRLLNWHSAWIWRQFCEPHYNYPLLDRVLRPLHSPLRTSKMAVKQHAHLFFL